MSVEEIAKFYHPKDSLGNLLDPKSAVKWVKERMSYVSLSEDSVKALKAGKVKPNAVQVLAKLSAEQQKDVLKSGGKLTASALRTAGKNGSSAPAATAAKPVKNKEPRSTGPKIPGVSEDQIPALQSMLSKAIEESIMPGGLNVSKMTPEDAVYAVCGVLLDILEGH
jgi:hypothetical protein